LWQEPRRRFCPRPAGWTIANAANVQEAPYGARGDGKADDTDALGRAIAANPAVYLPKGFYRITRPLRLQAHTFLVGTGTNH
jgi:polygalacturonase